MIPWAIETAAVTVFLALVVASVCRWARPGPSVRHLLWCLVLWKFLTPPLVRLELPALPTRTAPPVSAEGPRRTVTPAVSRSPIPVADRGGVEPRIEIETPKRRSDPSIPASSSLSGKSIPASVRVPVLPTAPSRSWRPEPRWLLTAWIVGTVLMVLHQAHRLFRLAGQLRPVAIVPDWLEDLVIETAAELRVRPPRLRIVEGTSTPLLWCLGPATLCVPDGLLDRLGRSAWAGVVAHELAHLKRRDHWTGRLQLLAGVLWWWDPVYWWTCRRLSLESEMACDALVVTALDGKGMRTSYARALVEVCEALVARRARGQVALEMSAAGDFLERRLTMILSGKGGGRVPWYGKLLALGAAVALVPAWGLAQQERPVPKNGPGVSLPKPAAHPKIAGAGPGPMTEGLTKMEVSPVLQDKLFEAQEALELARIELDNKRAEAQAAERATVDPELRVKQALDLEKRGFFSAEQTAKTKADLGAAQAKITIQKNEVRRAELAVRAAERRLQRALQEIDAWKKIQALNSRPAETGKSSVVAASPAVAEGTSGPPPTEVVPGLPAGRSGGGFGGGGGGFGGAGVAPTLGGFGGVGTEGGSEGGGFGGVSEEPGPVGGVAYRDVKSKAILAILEREVPIEFPEPTPLSEVLERLKLIIKDSKPKASLPIYFDPNATTDGGDAIDPNSVQVRMNVEGVPLRTTLKLMLRQAGLTYTVRDGLLIVSSPEAIREIEADEDAKTRSAPEELDPIIPSSVSDHPVPVPGSAAEPELTPKKGPDLQVRSDISEPLPTLEPGASGPAVEAPAPKQELPTTQPD